MKWLATFLALIFLSGIARADAEAPRLKMQAGKVLLAQASCAACPRRLQDCLSRCSGSTPCVQACYAENNRCVGQFCR